METELAYHAKFTYESIPDDIPSFEDAFDTNSLKQFYQQQQRHQTLTDFVSHDSTSDCSPLFTEAFLYREHESFIEMAKPVASSMPLFFCGSPETASTVSSKSLSGGFFDNLSQSSPIQNKNSYSFKKPFEIVRTKPVKELPQLKISFKGLDLFSQRERILSQSTVDMETEEMSVFERQLRTKKVFKVIRENKQKMAPQRKSSTQIKEGQQTKKTKVASPKMVPQEIPVAKSTVVESSGNNKERPVTGDHLSLMHLLDMLHNNKGGLSHQQIMSGFQQAMTPKSKEQI